MPPAPGGAPEPGGAACRLRRRPSEPPPASRRHPRRTPPAPRDGSGRGAGKHASRRHRAGDRPRVQRAAGASTPTAEPRRGRRAPSTHPAGRCLRPAPSPCPVAPSPGPRGTDRRARSAEPRPAGPSPGPDGRPRRRPSAAELFERVVPDDPPAMPFGRVKPADVDETLRMRSTPRPDESEPETSPDEQLTMRLGNDDETRPPRSRLGAAPPREFLRHHGQHHRRLAQDVIAREPQHIEVQALEKQVLLAVAAESCRDRCGSCSRRSRPRAAPGARGSPARRGRTWRSFQAVAGPTRGSASETRARALTASSSSRCRPRGSPPVARRRDTAGSEPALPRAPSG